MGDKNKTKSDKEPRIDDAINHAEACFWMAVEETYTEVEAEMPIPFALRTEFLKVMRGAIQAWLQANRPTTSPATATCDLVVQMRPPKQGERGWLVEALTAEDALAEILRESEELGWVADRDHDRSFDDCGMHAVTILVKPTLRALTQDELMKAQGVTPSPSADKEWAVTYDILNNDGSLASSTAIVFARDEAEARDVLGKGFVGKTIYIRRAHRADEHHHIFESVLLAMQDAEEMGGPTGAAYIELMENIAKEANKRANNYREQTK